MNAAWGRITELPWRAVLLLALCDFCIFLGFAILVSQAWGEAQEISFALPAVLVTAGIAFVYPIYQWGTRLKAGQEAVE